MNWLLLIWITVVGACVGSFLNVVIYRLPEGKSLSKPGSHCPKCGHMLRWWENIPVLAWFYLRGQCTQCKAKFSFQYPAIELLTAALFAMLFIVYYQTGLRPPFAQFGPPATWAVLVTHLVLLASLLAATMIDARLYIIPLQIPWLVTAVALVALPVAAWWEPGIVNTLGTSEARTTPVVNVAGVYAAGGATIGLAISLTLLYFRVLPRSFDDPAYEADVPPIAPPPQNKQERQAMAESFLTYPHPRREVLKESLFVALPLLGAMAALLMMPELAEDPLTGARDLTGGFSLPVRVLAGVVCGYFIGGALVWFTRILGTLGFGKEAMGLGDVHLLAAIGAVLGPLDTVFIFFIAPFFGLTFAVISMGISQLIIKRNPPPIPYGPYLAAAAVLMMILREPIVETFMARFVIL